MQREVYMHNVELEIREFVGNTIFSVDFIKKNGDLRTMVCRLNCKTNQNGKGLKYNPSDKGYIVVFDMQKKAYRTVNLNTVTKIVSKKKVLVIDHMDAEETYSAAA
jgi:hypothetical protein